MQKPRVPYIIVTALFCLAILPGAVMDIVQPEMVVAIVEKLGLPLHLLTLIGVWKLLGVAALATPKYRRLNEWAYAGFFFDLTGAAFLHAAAGDTAGIAPPLVIGVLLVASYRLRDAMRAATASTSEAMASPAHA